MQSGRFRGAGGWVTMNPEGTPDLIAMIPGSPARFLAIETKQKGETASLAQKTILAQINELGGIAVVLDHYDEEELDDLLQEAWEN